MYSTCCTLALIFLSLHLVSPSTSLSTDTICNRTFYPSFCKSTIPANNSISTQDCGKFFIKQYISSNNNLLSIVDGYLKNQKELPLYTIRALEDCKDLGSLSIDFLTDTLNSLSSASTLEASKATDVQSVLSAILTNQDTCFGGISLVESPSDIKSDFQTRQLNASMLGSVSLSIFLDGWANNTKSSATELDHSMRRLYTVPDNVIVNKTVVVDPSGNGNFTTINDALNAAPNNTNGIYGYYLIYVVAGVYEEYVNVVKSKKYVMMIGDGINQTIITGNRSVVDGWTTFDCGTFIVVGQGFVGVNMTIRNTAGAVKHQAVALRNNADLSTFYKCSLEGYQDTVYPHSLRQFYRECDMYGTVDFIFGNGVVVVQNCNIYPRLPLQGQFNAITAQGRTDINQNTGTSFQNCTILAAEDLGSTKTYLGRPWKLYSRVVFMESYMDSLIEPAGWSIWSGDFALNTSYYAEYNNIGPGSNTTNRVTWPGFHVINATDAINFDVSNFIAGEYWLPATGVPFSIGLMS